MYAKNKILSKTEAIQDFILEDIINDFSQEHGTFSMWSKKITKVRFD